MTGHPEHPGTVLPATEEQIDQVRRMMAGQVRNLVIPTQNETGETVLAEIFNAIVEGPKGHFRIVWRSFTTTRHSRIIDGFADNQETGGFAPLNMLLTDTSSQDIYARLYTRARLVPEKGIPQALFDITAIRHQRGELLKINRPEEFYEAMVRRVTIPVPIMDGDRHVGETHTDIPLDSLSGFAARSLADFVGRKRPVILDNRRYFPSIAEKSLPWQISPG